jgi:hypothetical protein
MMVYDPLNVLLSLVVLSWVFIFISDIDPSCASQFYIATTKYLRKQLKGKKDLFWLLVSVHGLLSPLLWAGEETEHMAKRLLHDRQEADKDN